MFQELTRMMNKRPDRRTNRTRRNLKEALLALVLEKGYDTVTIQEITHRADISRTTFYLHYRDKEQLLLECVDGMVNDLIQQIAKIPLTAWGREGLENNSIDPSNNPVQLIFEHAAEHANLYRVTLRVEGAYQALERLQEIISDTAAATLKEIADQGGVQLPPQVPLEVFSHYFAAALLGMITWWLENNTPYPPVHMATSFQKMFFYGAYQVLEV
jgi:AcrR family transcriptional regulator